MYFVIWKDTFPRQCRNFDNGSVRRRKYGFLMNVNLSKHELRILLEWILSARCVTRGSYWHNSCADLAMFFRVT